MINALALTLIAAVMDWDDEEATREYKWLKLMSSVKYDGYSDFRAGVRFLENLATWLRQFKPEDRLVAYSFVRNRLVYISSAEMQRVVETFIPEIVTPHLRKEAAEEVGIKAYQTWGSAKGVEAFNNLLRRSLFVGLSDGSRIDILRRANSGKLVQDQVVPMLDIGQEKWRDLKDELTKEQGPDARFDNVYLIDDFTASGTTFIRHSDEGKWKGKLKKFNDLVCAARQQLEGKFPIAENFHLHIHHYVSTDQAHSALKERVEFADKNWAEKSFGSFEITESLLLPPDLKMAARCCHINSASLHDGMPFVDQATFAAIFHAANASNR